MMTGFNIYCVLSNWRNGLYSLNIANESFAILNVPFLFLRLFLHWYRIATAARTATRGEADTLPAFYPHRHNRDHSFDSICLTCLLTIANARTEAELEQHDKDHVCSPSILSQRIFDLAHAKVGYAA